MRINPVTMADSPNALRTESGNSCNFMIYDLTLSGKAKYGRPSIIKTIPRTHKKYSIT
jgi:hypothetical protein